MSAQYTILLVDDEPDIRGALRRSLKDANYEFIEASDGAEALALLRDHDVDAVISDYNMPGMNGLDLLQQIRISQPEVLRLLLTARADVNLAVRALNEGSVHRFLLKPWDHIDLRGIIEMTLHTMRTPQAAAARK